MKSMCLFLKTIITASHVAINVYNETANSNVTNRINGRSKIDLAIFQVSLSVSSVFQGGDWNKALSTSRLT